MNPIVLFGYGIFFLIGLGGLISTVKNWRRCSMEVQARIVEIREEESSSGDDTPTTAYFPVFSYRVDGKVYRKRYSMAKNPRKYNVGEYVTLRIDPDHPEKFILPGEKTNWILFSVSFLFGLAMIIFCLLEK